MDRARYIGFASLTPLLDLIIPNYHTYTTRALGAGVRMEQSCNLGEPGSCVP